MKHRFFADYRPRLFCELTSASLRELASCRYIASKVICAHDSRSRTENRFTRMTPAQCQEVAVVLSVEEGPEFYWEKAEWTGNRVFTSEELDRLLGMKPKEVANQEKIDAGLTAIKRAYDTRGFIEAAVKPKEILDDTARLTTYNVAVDEGAQFHLGMVHFEGLPEVASKELIKSWQLKPGDVYDASYPSAFVSKVAIGKLKELGIRENQRYRKSKARKAKGEC